MSEEMEHAMMGLRSYMFEHVYTNPVAKKEETKASEMLKQLYFYYLEHISQLPDEFKHFIEQCGENEEQMCIRDRLWTMVSSDTNSRREKKKPKRNSTLLRRRKSDFHQTWN